MGKAKLLTGVQGAEPLEAPILVIFKDQNQHSEAQFLFLWFFVNHSIFFFLPSVIFFFWELRSCAPVDFDALGLE